MERQFQILTSGRLYEVIVSFMKGPNPPDRLYAFVLDELKKELKDLREHVASNIAMKISGKLTSMENLIGREEFDRFLRITLEEECGTNAPVPEVEENNITGKKRKLDELQQEDDEDESESPPHKRLKLDPNAKEEEGEEDGEVIEEDLDIEDEIPIFDDSDDSDYAEVEESQSVTSTPRWKSIGSLGTPSRKKNDRILLIGRKSGVKIRESTEGGGNTLFNRLFSSEIYPPSSSPTEASFKSNRFHPRRRRRRKSKFWAFFIIIFFTLVVLFLITTFVYSSIKNRYHSEDGEADDEERRLDELVDKMMKEYDDTHYDDDSSSNNNKDRIVRYKVVERKTSRRKNYHHGLDDDEILRQAGSSRNEIDELLRDVEFPDTVSDLEFVDLTEDEDGITITTYRKSKK